MSNSHLLICCILESKDSSIKSLCDNALLCIAEYTVSFRILFLVILLLLDLSALENLISIFLPFESVMLVIGFR